MLKTYSKHVALKLNPYLNTQLFKNICPATFRSPDNIVVFAQPIMLCTVEGHIKRHKFNKLLLEEIYLGIIQTIEA